MPNIGLTSDQSLLEKLKNQLVEACRVGDMAFADSIVSKIADLVAEAEPAEEPTEVAPEWNEDPQWIAYVASLETDIKKIANKYTMDEGMREDCEQEARIALYTIFPSQLREFALYTAGEMTEQAWKNRLKNYCKNAARNAVLSYLDSPKTGNWYIGRTRRVRDKETNTKTKVHVPARFSSLNELMEDSGLQVDETGTISWDYAAASAVPANHTDVYADGYEGYNLIDRSES